MEAAVNELGLSEKGQHQCIFSCFCSQEACFLDCLNKIREFSHFSLFSFSSFPLWWFECVALYIFSPLFFQVELVLRYSFMVTGFDCKLEFLFFIFGSHQIIFCRVGLENAGDLGL